MGSRKNAVRKAARKGSASAHRLLNRWTRSSASGHKPPSSFVIGATGPPSIADELPGMRQIVANVEGHPRQPAAGAPEKPAAVAGGRGFCHGPKSKVAFNALASGSAGCRHGTRPKLACHARPVR